MEQKDKKVFSIIGAIVIVILAIYISGFSSFLEWVCIVLVGIPALLSLVACKDDSKMILAFVVLAIITFGLLVWNESNNSSRKDKELKKLYAVNHAKYIEDSIKRVKEDSIQKIKMREEALQNTEDSKKLYEQEGDSIFGAFFFGMSENKFQKVLETINGETNGRISIANHDFRVNDYKFYKNQLYFLRLRSANEWVRYYFHDAHEYDDSEGLGNGGDIVDRVKGRLTQKYGNPNRDNGWHFTHKDIIVMSNCTSRSREGLLSTEFWAVTLLFKNPLIEMEADKTELENQKKDVENELQRKKESFAKGL